MTPRQMNRRPLLTPSNAVRISGLVAVLAAGAMTGCSSNAQWTSQNFTKYKAPVQDTPEQQAALASETLDPAMVASPYTPEQYFMDAQSAQLQHEWLSEAWNASADHEARRTAAQAEALRIQAGQSASFSEADYEQSGFQSRHQIELAEAQKLHGVFQAKLTELDTHADAQGVANNAEQIRQEALLFAAQKEWSSEVEKLAAEGSTNFARAQAEHQSMLAERNAVSERGTSEIKKMGQLVELTEQRAEAQVAQKRQNAKTTQEQTAARAAELRQQIKTTREKTQARVAELRQQAVSSQQQGVAHASEMRARAVAIEEQDVDETYRLMLSASEAQFAQSQAEAERLFSEADALETSLEAEVTRRISDASQSLGIDRTDFEEAMASIENFVQHGRAEVASKRVGASTVEKTARAEFVKAEATARAEKLRETATHQQELAEKEQKKIQAEAEAEAARVEASYFAMLAQQAKQGSVNRPGATQDRDPGASNNDASPVLSDAAPKGENMDPKHVAAFKAALAQASSLRKSADAEELALFATAEERRRSFEAWFTQREAGYEQQMAEANRFEQQTKAKINNFVAQAESMLKNATAQLGRNQMTAEAERRDALASITNMRADALATDKKTTALHTQLSAESLAAERNGASQVRSMEVILASTEQRGAAQASRYVAEANALERSQRAVVAQMQQEIRSAQQMLQSELAKLDQQAESFISVAEASFNENRAIVTAMGEINEATFDQLAAANEASARMNEAEVAYLRDLNLANQLVAEAAVDRVLANAEADLDIANSFDVAKRASISADTAIANYTVMEQWAIAMANEETTKARFDSRIVQTLAQRNSAYADLYEQNQQSRLRLQQAMATAATYDELSRRAMTNFTQRAEDFAIAAQDNWYSALAQPTAFATPQDPAQLEAQVGAYFNSPVVDVPINDD